MIILGNNHRYIESNYPNLATSPSSPLHMGRKSSISKPSSQCTTPNITSDKSRASRAPRMYWKDSQGLTLLCLMAKEREVLLCELVDMLLIPCHNHVHPESVELWTWLLFCIVARKQLVHQFMAFLEKIDISMLNWWFSLHAGQLLRMLITARSNLLYPWNFHNWLPLLIHRKHYMS